MRRGDIRWYTFKKPDKRRPVLILTRDSVIAYLGEVTIAPITSTIRNIPTEIVLTEADGMPHVCCVNLDHLQTVSKAQVGAIITTLHARQLFAVREALLFAFDF